MTKNEERNIAKCLISLRHFDQVFVIDSNSTDQTCQIAQAMGAEVFQFSWNGKYPKKKQWSLDNLPFKYDWVLFVDADEQVTPELSEEIGVSLSSDAAGYFVGYDYVFLNKVLKHGHRVHKLVLFNRHKGYFEEVDDLEAANMWEVEGHYQPRINGKVGMLKHRMIHNDHDSLYHYFERHNRYTDWEANIRLKGSLYQSKESQSLIRSFQKRAFQLFPYQGLLAFFHCYFLKLGILDGRAGFHYALARAFYYWQTAIKQQELSAITRRS